jgi:uncharacterized protein
MNTTIRKGQYRFYGDKDFTQGLSRCGDFNFRESEELELYGHTFLNLTNGSLLPTNDEETQFVHDIHSEQESQLYPVKLWKKYLRVVDKSNTYHGFTRNKIQDIPFEDNSIDLD